MRKYLIIINLLNALDGLITYLGVKAYGKSIEPNLFDANVFLHDDILAMILLVKIPTLIGISWLTWEYNKVTKREKEKFINPALVGLTILFIIVLIWNFWVLMGKL